MDLPTLAISLIGCCPFPSNGLPKSVQPFFPRLLRRRKISCPSSVASHPLLPQFCRSYTLSLPELVKVTSFLCRASSRVQFSFLLTHTQSIGLFRTPQSPTSKGLIHFPTPTEYGFPAALNTPYSSDFVFAPPCTRFFVKDPSFAQACLPPLTLAESRYTLINTSFLLNFLCLPEKICAESFPPLISPLGIEETTFCLTPSHCPEAFLLPSH